MTLRQKFVIAFALVAAIVAIVIGSVSYATTERALHNEIDVSLASAMTTLLSGGTLVTSTGVVLGAGPRDSPRDSEESIIQTAQSISTGGHVVHLSGADVALPIDSHVRTLASTGVAGARQLQRVRVGSHTYEVLTQALGSNKGAIQVGRDLDESDRILQRLAITTLVVGLVVLLLAAGVGAVIARRMTRRLSVLALMAEKVSQTGQLDVDFAMRGRDEVGRLSSSLQSMLTELSASKDAQQRLVQNAGHELRTPLTSLRTNISVLRRFSELSTRSQQQLLDDVEGESRELTDLVNELVELATDRRADEEPTAVDIADLAARLAVTFGRRSGRRIVATPDSPVLVLGRPRALERAMSNLLENALKFDPEGREPIEISVSAEWIVVSDRGPGLDPADMASIFDRFFRADTARGLPGSGLGLAIVAEVAASHGGVGRAAARDGGGAVIGFTLGPETFLPKSNP